MNPDLERMLEEYVRGAPERSAIQATALQRILNQLEVHETKDDARHLELKNAIAGANARVDKLERKAEDTGSHDITELRRALAERKKRDWDITKTGLGAVGSIFLLLIGLWLGKAFR